MDCDKCLETLSEYQSGALGENDSVFIRTPFSKTSTR